MIIFNLKTEWYEKIKNREKTHEYRLVKPYWTKRFAKALCVTPEELNSFTAMSDTSVRFVKGYTKEFVSGRLYSIKIRNGKNTDLNVDSDVYDIEFELFSNQ